MTVKNKNRLGLVLMAVLAYFLMILKTICIQKIGSLTILY
ncbi:hypothetical protein RR45_GL000432 [Lactococcus chungangensis CAU 28 = DSM 22330]|uniref:Uncharacterized protein n=1 Tax=Pseudolactococcus chungangensis CAU 28 = DSM 22330 TaxID=1122154 RepID=A0ABX4I6Y0_9LACT|nr:hypothetical protein RR45_GL000432 [Lactococcus chungangensis CAU 28 = DSM 22330]